MTPEELFNQPWPWLVIIAIILYFIVAKWKAGPPSDPSTKPWYGRILRRDLMQKEAKKRMDEFGTKCTIDLEKGISRIGQIKFIEHDRILITKEIENPRTKIKKHEPDYYARIDRFKYRKHGFMAKLISIFGFGWKFITITPDAYSMRREDRFNWLNLERTSKLFFNIDPTAHIIDDSGIWSLAMEKALNANDEYVIKAHHENLHGQELDFVRRLAVHSVTVAASMEKASHESRLKEEERKRRTAAYS